MDGIGKRKIQMAIATLFSFFIAQIVNLYFFVFLIDISITYKDLRAFSFKNGGEELSFRPSGYESERLPTFFQKIIAIIRAGFSTVKFTVKFNVNQLL